MKLGESGEAFFVEEVSDDDDDFPEYLACSPIPMDGFLFNQEGHDYLNLTELNSQRISTGKARADINSNENFTNHPSTLEESDTSNQCSDSTMEFPSELPVQTFSEEFQVVNLPVNSSQTSLPSALTVNVSARSNSEFAYKDEKKQPQNMPKTFRAETVINSRNAAEFRPIQVEASIGVQTDVDVGHFTVSDNLKLEKGGSNTSMNTIDECKSFKRKRRKRSLMKKKGFRKNGLNGTEEETKDLNVEPSTIDQNEGIFEMESLELVKRDSSISSHQSSMSCTGSCTYHVGGIMIGSTTHFAYNPDCELCIDHCKDLACAVSTGDSVAKILSISDSSSVSVEHELSRMNSSGADFHFFSDTEATSDRRYVYKYF